MAGIAFVLDILCNRRLKISETRANFCELVLIVGETLIPTAGASPARVRLLSQHLVYFLRFLSSSIEFITSVFLSHF